MADFIPSFEGTWSYQSFLVLPTASELSTGPGSPVTAKKWAVGTLLLSEAGDQLTAGGFLTFPSGARLKVFVTFAAGRDGSPAKFEATGTGESGAIAGAVYELAGWAFPSPTGGHPTVRGSVRAVRGPAARPDVELGGLPVGTVGAFVLTR